MKHLMATRLGQFRVISFSEGVSYLLLLFIAMPLKYMGNNPILVEILGPIHGILFVFFVAQLGRVAVTEPWGIVRTLIAFVASIIPFGAFFLEKSLKKEMETKGLTASTS